jgi:hypothetical protein
MAKRWSSRASSSVTDMTRRRAAASSMAHDLPTVGGGGNPGSAVNGETDKSDRRF